MNVPTQPSWWSRNWKWALPLTCIVPFVGCGGFVGGIFLLVFGAMKSSDVYQESISRAKNNVRVQALLGEPIKPGWHVTGQINIRNDAGDADLWIPLTGPKGSATLHAVAKKSRGKWDYLTQEVESSDHTTKIDLLPK